MDLNWSAEDIHFRQQARDFLATDLTPEMRMARRKMTSVYSSPELALAWQAILNRRGWAAPAWPMEHGGCDWTLSQRYIFASELAGAYAAPFQPHAAEVGVRLRASPGGFDNAPAGPESSWPVTSRYFNDRAGSIYTGTNEIQRNIMAKAILRV